MAYMTESEGVAAMALAIANHIEGTQGSKTKAASIEDILLVLATGPQTIEAIANIVIDLKDEYV